MHSNRVRPAVPIVSCLVLAALFLAGPSAARGQTVFSIKLCGGLNSLSGGELNDGLQGRMDFMSDFGAWLGYSARGAFVPVGAAYSAEGDIIFDLTPFLAVGLGVGYIENREARTEIVLSHPVLPQATLRENPKVTAVPLRASLYVSFRLSRTLNLMIQAGGAYYLTKLSSIYRLEEGDEWEQTEISASGGGLGFHGGLGLEVRLASNLSFILEGTGRYVKVGDFTGTTTDMNSYGMGDTEEGDLYYFVFDTPPLGSYPTLTVSDTEPSGYGIRDVRRAKVDLSGFTVQAGLLVKF